MALLRVAAVIWALLHLWIPSSASCVVTARVQALVNAATSLDNASLALGPAVDLLAATQLGINASLLPSGVCVELLAVPVDFQQVSTTILASDMLIDPLTVAIVAVAPSRLLEKARFVADGARLPLLAVTATADSLSEIDMFFRAIPPDTVQAAATVDVATALASEVAVLYEETVYGRGLATSFAADIQTSVASGMDLTFSASLGESDAPWEAVVTAIVNGAAFADSDAQLQAKGVDTSQSGVLSTLRGLLGLMERLRGLPLTRAVYVAGSEQPVDAALVAAQAAGLLADHLWMTGDAAASARAGAWYSGGNATVLEAIQSAARGRVAFAPDGAKSTAVRTAVHAQWARLPRWHNSSSGAASPTFKTVLDAWAVHGLAVDDGDGMPPPFSNWQGAMDAGKSLVEAVNRACATAAAAPGAGTGPCGTAAGQAVLDRCLASCPRGSTATVGCNETATTDPVCVRQLPLGRDVIAAEILAASTGSKPPLVPAASSATGWDFSPSAGSPASTVEYAIVNDDIRPLPAGSPTPTGWTEVARWRATSVSSVAKAEVAPTTSLVSAVSTVSLLSSSLAVTGSLFAPLSTAPLDDSAFNAVAAGWWWPGTGRGSVPELKILYRLGIARYLSMNETHPRMVEILRGALNVSSALRGVKVTYLTDREQLEAAASRPVPSGISASGLATAQDLDELVAEVEAMAERGVDIVVLAGGDEVTAETASQLALRKPGIELLLLRSADENSPPNVVSVLFREDEAAFMAGAAAAAVSQAAAGVAVQVASAPSTAAITGTDADNDGAPDQRADLTVGVLMSDSPFEKELRLVSGFASGVRQACPACPIKEERLSRAATRDELAAAVNRLAASTSGSPAPSGNGTLARLGTVVFVAEIPTSLVRPAAQMLAQQNLLMIAGSDETRQVLMEGITAMTADTGANAADVARFKANVVGQVQTSLRQVVQLLASQRYEAAMARRTSSSRQLSLGSWQSREVRALAGLEPDRSADLLAWRRGLQSQAETILGVNQDAISFDLGEEFLQSLDSSTAQFREAARAGLAWAQTGIQSGSLETQVVVSSGLPYVLPTSCPVGWEFRESDDRDPTKAACFRCPESTYSLTRGGTCLPCPNTAICEGGSHIAATANYWVGEDGFTLYACNPYSCCVKGNCSHPDNPSLSSEEREVALQQRCNNGRVGLICGSCPEGEVLVSSAIGCGQCNSVQWVIVVAFIGVCVAFVLYMLLRNHHVRSAALFIAVDFMNTALLVFSPSRQFAFTISFGAATMELSASPFSRECIAPMGPTLRLLSPMFIPVTLLAALALAWLYMRCTRWLCRGKSTKAIAWGAWRVQLVLWVIVTIAYSAFARVGVDAMTCREVDGVRVVASVPDLHCDGVGYIILSTTTGFVAFATLFGVPSVIYYYTYRTMAALGVLTAGNSITMVTRVAKSAGDAIQKFARRAREAKKRVAAAKKATRKAKARLESRKQQGSGDAKVSALEEDGPQGGQQPQEPPRRRESLAWLAEVAQMKVKAVELELEAIGAPKDSLVGLDTAARAAAAATASASSSESAGAVQRATPGSAAEQTAKKKQQRRRLSALGLPPGYKGWIHDAVSNGYFWVQAKRDRAPLGPFFVHPSYAAAGGAGEEAVGAGRGIKWDLVPAKALEAAVVEGSKHGDVPDPVMAVSQPGSCVVVLDPHTGQLVAINFHKPPPADLEERLRRKARAIVPMVTMLSKSKLRTAKPGQSAAVAWGEAGSGVGAEEDGIIEARQRSMTPPEAGSDHSGDMGTTTAVVPFSRPPARSGGVTTPSGVGIHRSIAPAMSRSVTEPLSRPAPPSKPRAPKARAKRRASILDDPARLRKAMALTMMSGRVSGADEQLRQLVGTLNEASNEDDTDSDLDSDEEAGDFLNESDDGDDDGGVDYGSAGLAAADEMNDDGAGVQGGRPVIGTAAASYHHDGKQVPTSAASSGRAATGRAVAATRAANTIRGAPERGRAGDEAGEAGGSKDGRGESGSLSPRHVPGAGIINSATSVFKTLLQPPSDRRAKASGQLTNEVHAAATDAARKRNLFADMDSSSMELRMDNIPEAFRGTARLYLPFRFQFRAHGYAMLLLRRGIATLLYVQLSQHPAIKQAVLFLYFVGWLLWQVAYHPFQDASDNWFATLTLAVIVATAGLELHFLSLIEGPLWVTWTQVVLLAAPLCYMLMDMGGEMIDVLDERALLPAKCSVGPDYINSSGPERHGRRAMLCTLFCIDICCPTRCRRSLRRRCWCICASLRCISCNGQCCCCCRRCCRILLEPPEESSQDDNAHAAAKHQALMDSASKAVKAARKSMTVAAGGGGDLTKAAIPAGGSPGAQAGREPSTVAAARSTVRAVTLARRRKQKPHSKRAVTLGPTTAVTSPGAAKLAVVPSHTNSRPKPRAPPPRSETKPSGSTSGSSSTLGTSGKHRTGSKQDEIRGTARTTKSKTKAKSKSKSKSPRPKPRAAHATGASRHPRHHAKGRAGSKPRPASKG